MRGHLTQWCGCASIAVLGLSLSACHTAHPASVTAAAQKPVSAAPRGIPPAAPVQPGATPRPDFLLASGPITQEQQLDLVALRAGQIRAVNGDVGTRVTAGQELLLLDDRQLLADRSAAQYKLASLRVGVRNRDAEVKMRDADLRRAEEMRKAGINTQEDYEHIVFLREATLLQKEGEQQQVLAATAGLEALDLQLAQMRVTAPFNGVISQRFVRPGQYVAVSDKLFHLVGNSPLEVRFTLPGEEVRHIRRGENIAIAASADFQVSTNAIISLVSPVIDPGSGMIEVTAVLSQTTPGIVPGMIVSIRISRSRESD